MLNRRHYIAALMLCSVSMQSFALEFRSVKEAGVALYEAPSITSKKLFALSKHYPLEVVIQEGSWAKVRDSEGTIAWIPASALSQTRTVVVIKDRVAIRTEAKESAGIRFRVDKGVWLEVIESDRSGWVKVKHQDGLQGYVAINQIWGQ